jgi:TonB-linked SusC/RagA family outer membrane protein
VLGVDEVVVTGTGVPTERRQLGNAISTVDGQDIERSTAGSIDRALQGKIAGAQVQQNSGNPAGGISVRLRGASTVLGDANPLYIVDGVIINNDSPELIDLGGGAQNRLVDLNPNDIARIEVVKGAAAAALYGSRANSGVVQIFTKRGQAGPPRVSFTTRVQTDAVRSTLPVNRAQNANGDFLDNSGDPLPEGQRRWDWQDFIFDRAYGTEQSLSISGGTESTTYSISGAHRSNQGIVEGTNFRRVNGRLRLDQTLTDWASLSGTAAFSRSTSQEVPNGGLNANYGALTGFIFGPNTFDPRANEFGEYPNQGILANPIEVRDRFDFAQETERFRGSTSLSLTPLDGLSIDYLFGLDTHTQRATAFIPRGTSAPGLGGGFARRATQNQLQTNSDLNIRYQTALRSRLESTTLIGGTLQYETGTRFSAQSENLTPVSEVIQSGTTQRDANEFRSPFTIYGLFAQETLGWNDRLFLTGAARLDASSSFGEGERWQFYPKGSASYIVSELDAWQRAGIDHVVPRLKLRASIGVSGGLTSIGPFDRFTNYNPESYEGRPGLQPSSQLGALDARPERQREIELGADFGLLNDRLAVEATYYTQRTTDLLLNRSLAPTSGFLSRLQNVGTLTNQGFELLMRGLILDRPGRQWISTLTFSRNRNEVDGLEEDVLIFPDSFGLVGAINGQPLGIYYGSSFARNDNGEVIDQNGNVLVEDDDNLWRMRDGTPTEPGDGVPAASGEDRIIGDPNPDFIASWINDVRINQFEFRMQWDAVVGQDVFNFTRRLAALSVFGTLDDYERELEGDLPSGYTSSVFGIFEHWVEDGSFLKLREISLAYTLSAPTPQVDRVRLSLSGRNLLSIDGYSGYDPEVNVAGQRTGVRNFDFVEVPIPRSFTLGATVTF